jgi:hypothetical protein
MDAATNLRNLPKVDHSCKEQDLQTFRKCHAKDYIARCPNQPPTRRSFLRVPCGFNPHPQFQRICNDVWCNCTLAAAQSFPRPVTESVWVQ